MIMDGLLGVYIMLAVLTAKNVQTVFHYAC